jgi:hypothetical protein
MFIQGNGNGKEIARIVAVVRRADASRIEWVL